MPQKITATQLESIMAQSTGTTQYHKLTFMPLLATDGVAAVAQAAGAFWLVDAIASYQPKLLKKGTSLSRFQLWELSVKDSQGTLTCRADLGKKPVVTQKFKYTDFPSGNWQFYVARGSVGDKPAMVIMVPMEY